MAKTANDLGHSLLPMAISGCVGAVGLAIATPASAAVTVVAQLVAGLAINHASDYIPSLLNTVGSTDPLEPNHDLERVAKHALLTILYETLEEQGWTKGQIGPVIKQASASWDTRVFPDGNLDRQKVLGLMRNPQPLRDTEGLNLARHLLSGHHQVAWEPYGEALQSRFAHTYALLLRNDTRAFRAVTLYLQQLQLQDLIDLKGELKRLTEILSRPQPTLERYEQLSAKDATRSVSMICSSSDAPHATSGGWTSYDRFTIFSSPNTPSGS